MDFIQAFTKIKNSIVKTNVSCEDVHDMVDVIYHSLKG